MTIALQGFPPELAGYGHLFLLMTNLVIASITSAHAVLWKRDARSAIIWVSLIWFIPFAGAALYLIFGINRIQRRATRLRTERHCLPTPPLANSCLPHEIARQLGNPANATDVTEIANTIDAITDRSLLPGNRIQPLVNGNEAFPEMLRTIAQARKSITLSTYIFDQDPSGARFASALAQAQQRGVAIRILVDSTGALYSWPPITDRLRQLDLRFARFLPPSKVIRPLTFNLHNHRKIMVVDGRIGFTGGMNIRHANVINEMTIRPVHDIHFKLEGPVVAHLQSAFAEDWAFATNEQLTGEDWFPPLRKRGTVLARGITDGPDEDLDKLIWTIIAALNAAKTSVSIITPYFLPETQIIAALNAAALRGVHVRILIPSKNNLPFMNWAMSAMLWQVLHRGCHVYATPPPFDHSKLMIVDQCWCLIGSANWDARSLRLNFEFNVECYSRSLATALLREVDRKLEAAHPITLRHINERSLPIKLRDGFTRLLSPLL